MGSEMWRRFSESCKAAFLGVRSEDHSGFLFSQHALESCNNTKTLFTFLWSTGTSMARIDHPSGSEDNKFGDDRSVLFPFIRQPISSYAFIPRSLRIAQYRCKSLTSKPPPTPCIRRNVS